MDASIEMPVQFVGDEYNEQNDFYVGLIDNEWEKQQRKVSLKINVLTFVSVDRLFAC